MKRNPWTRLACAGLLGSTLLFGGMANASIVTDKAPMLTYADHSVPKYDNPGGKRVGIIPPNVALVHIKSIRSDGWAYGSYPIEGGKRVTRWFELRELQGYESFQNYTLTIDADRVVYRTSQAAAKTGKALLNAKVTVVGEEGNYLKIIYRVNGGNEWKMGWIEKEIQKEDPVVPPDNPVNNGGTVINQITINNTKYEIDTGGGDIIANNVNSEIDSSKNKNATIDSYNQTDDHSVHDSYNETNTNSKNTTDDHSTTTTNTEVNLNSKNGESGEIPANAEAEKAKLLQMYRIKEYNGHYYRIFDNVCPSWEEAKAYCESLGGHLAIIEDAKENDWLFRFAKSEGYTDVYFGLSNAGHPSVWKWVDGSRLGYNNWAIGEPSQSLNVEHYGMFYFKYSSGQWNDGSFDYKGTDVKDRTFFCEWDSYESIDFDELGRKFPNQPHVMRIQESSSNPIAQQMLK